MPQTTSHPTALAPSTEGSKSVSEILSRIQVRDPSHKPTGIYGRRASDYESHSPKLQTAMLFTLAAFIVGSVGWFFLPELSKTGTSLSKGSFEKPMPAIEEPISVPKAIHPAPEISRTAPSLRSRNVLPSPENLRTRFMGPRMLEFQWDSLGNEYAYLVYASASPTMDDAWPVLEQPIPAPHVSWIPEDGIRNVWVAVRGLDALGHPTAFSQPLLVQLPY